MVEHSLTAEQIMGFLQFLKEEERVSGTLEKYRRDLRHFAQWLDGRGATRELAAEWKEQLQSEGYQPTTINSMLAVINTFFRFAGWEECRVKYLRVQRRIFREKSKELSRTEYERLVVTARSLGRERLALLIETMGSTGIRASEVQYITVEAAQQGRTEISLKGKIRTILLPAKLCRKILKYAKKNEIASGEVFITRSGKSLRRRQIWAEMKGLCRQAGVEPSKVFPHNLRHLFATVFYRAYKDVVRLADVLGHSSVETTRIYLKTTGAEHAQQLEHLKLVI